MLFRSLDLLGHPLVLLFLVNLFIGLRVTEEVEREGLDVALHGEAVQ